MFLLLAIMVVSTPVMESQAAEDVIENIYEEHQYTTENPDSNEAEKLFEKEIERDGKNTVSQKSGQKCWKNRGKGVLEILLKSQQARLLMEKWRLGRKNR